MENHKYSVFKNTKYSDKTSVTLHLKNTSGK